VKRLFVAIQFEHETKLYLSSIQTKLVELSEKGKYYPLENFHLTLEFIGLVPEKLISPLWMAIEDAISESVHFEITLTHLGVFNKKNKLIPWVGIDVCQSLIELQKKIMIAVSSVIEHPSDHGYVPHITLGRQVVISSMPELSLSKKIVVKEIVLMESSSRTGTLLYTPIRRRQLL